MSINETAGSFRNRRFVYTSQDVLT